MAKDFYAVLIEDVKDMLFSKHLPFRQGRYEYQRGRQKVIRMKLRGKHRTWIVPQQGNFTTKGYPVYVLTEDSIYPLCYYPHKPKWDTESLNAVIEANMVNKGVKKMGRPLSQQINLKMILIIGGLAAAAFFIFQAVQNGG